MKNARAHSRLGKGGFHSFTSVRESLDSYGSYYAVTKLGDNLNSNDKRNLDIVL